MRQSLLTTYLTTLTSSDASRTAPPAPPADAPPPLPAKPLPRGAEPAAAAFDAFGLHSALPPPPVPPAPPRPLPALPPVAAPIAPMPRALSATRVEDLLGAPVQAGVRPSGSSESLGGCAIDPFAACGTVVLEKEEAVERKPDVLAETLASLGIQVKDEP